MKAKDLIEKLQSLPGDTEVVLWSWNAYKSIYDDLTTTSNPYHLINRGYFCLMVDEHNPLDELNKEG